MKKTILSFLTFLSMYSIVSAQTVDDGKKFIYYERLTSAKQALQHAVAANSKDPQAIYWLGQAYIFGGQLDSAKTIYQNALSAGVNDPLIWVGAGHVDILQGGDVNTAKQKFEQAITATTATKGKNKGQPSADVLTAIGRAMAAGSSQQGDASYGIDKLKQAAQLDPTNPDVFVNLGLCYLKEGGDHGGEAVEAFRQATVVNPQYARGYYRIGRVYQSQRNKESMDEWYGKAIAADPTFAPVYLQYFQYYSEKDVSTAKEYLDKYVANADKDCNTEFFVGNYLIRAGKYQEALQQAKSMESGGCAGFSRLNVLYAASYDRLGDSVQAKNYTQKFFAVATPYEIQPSYYAFAGRVYAKFPETRDSAITYFQKAIQSDTVKEEQKAFVDSAAKIAAGSGNYRMILDLLHLSEQLNGGKLKETEYYNLSKNIIDAATASAAAPFDSVKYMMGDSVLQAYAAAYPDKPQGYSFRTRFAKMSDKDTSRGLAIDPITSQNKFLTADTAASSKKTLFTNYYYLLIYYAQYAKDLPKEQEYQKAIDITNQMKQVYTDPNSEEYQFADKTGKQIQQTLDKYNKSKAAGGGGTGASGKSQK